MTNQEIYKKLAAIYLMIDKARSELEDLEADVRESDDDMNLYLELSDLAANTEQLAGDISELGNVQDILEGAYS